jgi:DNA-3-methyladenine glycosylase I
MIGRCEWANGNDLMMAYHDTEWGVPLHDDKKLFEFLVLDAFQAGLSWAIVLKKRENFRKAFDFYDIAKIAKYDSRKITSLLKDEGIIRNKLKVGATVDNAKAFLKTQKEFDSFDNYIWQFVGHAPVKNRWKSISNIPATSAESDAMSKDLKARGFRFVGSTICYAFMQAAGMINDHLITCPRHDEVG